MMKTVSIRTSLAAAVAAGACVSSAAADLGGVTLTTSASQPVYLTNDGSSDRRYLVERTGTVRLLNDDGSLGATFLDVSADVAGLDREGGLLGVAFHPGYADASSPGYRQVFLNYTEDAGNDTLDTVIERVTVDDLAATTPGVTRTPVLSVAQPARNHNAGWLGFSPVDGYLYVPLGDGGGANDPFAQGQDRGTLLGGVVRIDVDRDDFADPARNYGIPDDNPFTAAGDAGADELVAYGLRNPYRSSFDRLTGDLYLADVGQNAREEISVLPAGQADGQNFGWVFREGFIETPGVDGDLAADERTDPIFDYAHDADDSFGRSITGGFVYRGDELGPAWEGRYFFGDFISGRLFALDPENPDAGAVDLTDLVLGGRGTSISGFGEDADGELYVLDFSGSVIAIVPEPASLALLGMGGLLLRRRR